MNDLISIIVPVYKVERYLQNCVESVLNQTYTKWELILVDDGSPDKCPQLCDDYSTKDSRIKVLHKENGGIASARNVGIKSSRGDFLTFLDSDDFLRKDYLAKMHDYAVLYNADIVQCDYIRGGDTKFPSNKERVSVKDYSNHSVFISGAAKVILTCKLYRASLFKDNLIVEGQDFEDDWTSWRYYYHSRKIVVSNEKLYYYTYNQNSTMSMHRTRIPDISCLEPDAARISFFVKTGEKDLEDCSRLKICKVIFLLICHNGITAELDSSFFARFKENWNYIRSSQYVSPVYKLLFVVFNKCPKLVVAIYRLVKR